MRTSPTIAALAPALSAAQGKLQAPSKDGASNYGSYVLLGDVLVDVRAVLSAHGLAVVQSIVGADLVTTILHTSGEWIATDYPLARDPNPQRQGSAVTYARRYSLLAALGLAGVDDDDDGAAASTPQATRAQARAVGAKPPKEAPADSAARKAAHDPAWDAERTKFCSALTAEGTSYDDVSAWLDAQGIGSPSTLGTDGRRAVYADVRRSGPRRVELDEWLGRRDADGGAA